MKQDKAKAGNKREVIMDAAVQVFSQKGYHNTRMEEIAVAAGIGKGTIYEYFQSKLQLFQEMLGRSMEIYYSNMSSNNVEKMSIEDRIKLLFRTHFDFCLKNRELTQIIFRDDIFDEELKEWAAKMHKEKESNMQALMSVGIACGELRPMDTKLASMIVTGVLHSIWMPLIFEDWQVEPDDVSNQLTDLIMHGLAG